VRSMILDGVVPPELVLGPQVALDAEHSLLEVFNRCLRDTECHDRFGDPTVAYHTLRSALQAHPVTVSLSDPTTGTPAKFDFTGYHLATVLRLASYTAEQSALLPLMLHGATASGDFVPLAAQFLLVNRSYGDAIAYGMHNSVVCSEDVPSYDTSRIDRAALEKTYLGTTQIDGLHEICSVWPIGPVDKDFHSPLQSAVPTLLLSGGNDPVTPPSGAQLARQHLSRSLHIILQDFGHGQLTAPCVDRVMARFVTTASVDNLDISCIKNDKPMPFFISAGGPPP
jgi:pimeloyl-ACP methyl ester carboxylesterase